MSPPEFFEMVRPPFMVLACLIFAWLSFFRPTWLTRGWNSFGIGIGPKGMRVVGYGFLAGGAYWAIKLGTLIATRIGPIPN